MRESETENPIGQKFSSRHSVLENQKNTEIMRWEGDSWVWKCRIAGKMTLVSVNVWSDSRAWDKLYRALDRPTRLNF